MVQRSSDAASKDAQLKLSKEECASSMEQTKNVNDGQRRNDAVLKGAQILFRREEYVGDTAQSFSLKDAQIKLRKG